MADKNRNYYTIPLLQYHPSPCLGSRYDAARVSVSLNSQEHIHNKYHLLLGTCSNQPDTVSGNCSLFCFFNCFVQENHLFNKSLIFFDVIWEVGYVNNRRSSVS